MCIRDRRSWSTTGSTCSAAPAAARSCTGTPGRRRRRSCSRALDLVEDAGADEKLAHGRAHDAFLPGALASDELEQVRARDHHEIVLLGQMPRAALEGLAQQTLDAVADDGAAQLLRDRQPPPLDDHLTRAGAHPLAKAVGLAALAGVRLIGPLHSFLARLPILRTCSIAVRRRPGQFGPAGLRRTVHTAAA